MFNEMSNEILNISPEMSNICPEVSNICQEISNIFLEMSNNGILIEHLLNIPSPHIIFPRTSFPLFSKLQKKQERYKKTNRCGKKLESKVRFLSRAAA